MIIGLLFVVLFTYESTVMFKTLAIKIPMILLFFSVESKRISLSNSNSKKIVAVGDLHGDMEKTLETLKMSGVIDDNNHWALGDNIFVQTGDILDRGPDDEYIHLFMKELAKQAKKNGGQVVALLGNHEIFNFIGDLKSVHKTLLQGREERMSIFNTLGEYIRSLPTVALVGDTIFCHGGLSKEYVDILKKYQKLSKKSAGRVLEFLNYNIANLLSLKNLDENDKNFLEHPNSPLFYRGIEY